MEIFTERLILRELTLEDTPALCEVLGDREIMRYYPCTLDKERVRGWIEKNLERYRIFGFGLWAVCLKENGRLIGDCGLTMQNINGSIRPEIGYHIRRDMQRRGYAKESACAVCGWAFENTPFRVLYSYMKHENVSSAKTAMSYGAQFAESYEDDGGVTDVYAITREEWEKIRAVR